MTKVKLFDAIATTIMVIPALIGGSLSFVFLITLLTSDPSPNRDEFIAFFLRIIPWLLVMIQTGYIMKNLKDS